ncbi:extracellular fatty acid-binding protein-like isoform X2 [Aquila chrysaetos chrysaetos]|uniref:extracellular fatty acid-binding protein-like isoform X2 n=1 Tax=Aquila chrysaetos chrysaetos TaxID=223781 RepID=UPI001B7D482F|nr:extracellular fatty acid-binding protein-like isoform X2 [Aquila chrysaetos chrysaetos]
MRTVGLSLGLALLCLLRAEAENFGAAGLDTSKIAGKWHIIALASDSEGYLQKKDELKMAMASIAVLREGDLKVSFAILTPEGCKKRELIYKETGVPGEYYSSGRTQQVSPKITALFKKLAREKSFTDEMITMLPSQEECSLDEA